jgi:hypothetical protein
MISNRSATIFKAWINPVISLVFVGTFALGAFLIVWKVAFNENPIANALAQSIERDTVLSNN